MTTPNTEKGAVTYGLKTPHFAGAPSAHRERARPVNACLDLGQDANQRELTVVALSGLFRINALERRA
jgi:hypothetical protein